ncbi:MAG: NYN domain-containing protein [Dehalococcoidia bacterium]|jgi:uncharacterized LabA/DUF88 family protein
MADRIVVFIDGRNVHYRLVELGWPTEYDVEAFARAITQHLTLTAVYYYNATPLQKYTKEPEYGRQLRYYAHIESQAMVTFRKGYLSDAGGRLVEKQVDVMLTADMLRDALKDKYDIAALVSADGDFGPVVEDIRREGKRVVNFVFRKKRSFSLATVCNEVRFLKQKHFAAVDCSLPSSDSN